MAVFFHKITCTRYDVYDCVRVPALAYLYILPLTLTQFMSNNNFHLTNSHIADNFITEMFYMIVRI